MGKTTCAAAAAVGAAEQGRRVLVVSTDPAHSLGDALGVRLSARPSRIALRRGALFAAELDADRAFDRWMGRRQRALRTIAERGTYLDGEDIDRLFNLTRHRDGHASGGPGLSLPGVDELVGLVELERLARAGRYDRVVVDTAPTGHTLRLLATPRLLVRVSEVLDDMQRKHRFLAQSLGGRYQPDAADDVIAQIAEEGGALEAMLRDPARCAFAWVLLPERMSVEETRDGVGALEAAQIPVVELLVNRVTPPPREPCARCAVVVRAEREAVAELRSAFPRRPLRFLPELVREPRGVPALREVARGLRARSRGAELLRGRAPRAPRAGSRKPTRPARDRPAWLAALAPPGLRLLVFGGKGGVGKTTCAAAAALALAEARPASRLLLLSADPAHSLGDALGVPLGDDERKVAGAPPGLRARELDAERSFGLRRERYRAAVDALFDELRGGSRFDAALDRAVVQDLFDLAPTGLDELLALVTVNEALFPQRGTRPAYDAVVLDTAPTGHALRLLEMPATALAWVQAFLAILLKYREVIGLGETATELVQNARELRALHALLRDPKQAAFVAVARPAELVRAETERLLARLRRLSIPVPAVLVVAGRRGECRRCQDAARAETQALRAAAKTLSSPRGGGCAMFQAPAVAPPPQGVAALRAWSRTWTEREMGTDAEP